MIAESYDIITDSPTKRIYEAVKTIPKGKVATYGKVAGLPGIRECPEQSEMPCTITRIRSISHVTVL